MKISEDEMHEIIKLAYQEGKKDGKAIKWNIFGRKVALVVSITMLILLIFSYLTEAIDNAGLPGFIIVLFCFPVFIIYDLFVKLMEAYVYEFVFEAMYVLFMIAMFFVGKQKVD